MSQSQGSLPGLLAGVVSTQQVLKGNLCQVTWPKPQGRPQVSAQVGLTFSDVLFKKAAFGPRDITHHLGK